MVAIIHDADLEERLKAQRAAWGSDKWDEVWEGTYILAPLPNNEHQEIAGWLTSIFTQAIGMRGLGAVHPGVNVSDREDWKQNYRCPDVTVFLKGTTAKNRDTFWLGGPDCAVEIVSRGDKSRDKLPFYAKVRTRELLIVDRDPWQLELFRLSDNDLVSAGRSDTASNKPIESQMLPFAFRLVAGEQRPQIEVVHTADQQTWLV